MRKVALFAFNGDFMCFIHVLLNALDMNEKGYDVQVIVEGSAVKVVPEMSRGESPLFGLYQKAREANVIAGVCRACSNKMNVTHAVEAEGLPYLDDMSGHPSMSSWMEQGYEIISF
jgi:hypothetical protein